MLKLKKEVKIEVEDSLIKSEDLDIDNMDTDFIGFYSTLVPYSDMMTLLLIFFLFFFVIKDTETGWQTVADDQTQIIEDNQVVVDSEEYEEVVDLNERVISIPGEILFESGAAQLKWNSQNALLRIAREIKEITSDGDEWQIRVEGHTDNIPISTSKFASNWELSTARALSIVKFFLRNNYFSADQLQIMGYGEFKPLVPNNSIENRNKNRRVEIKLSRTKK